MTLLTNAQIGKFESCMVNHDYETAVKSGIKLLQKDFRDGAGIRYGVMCAAGAIGDAKNAEMIAKAFAAETPFKGCKGPFGTYDPSVKIDKDDISWFEEIELGMAYPLAVAYWKNGNEDRAADVVERNYKKDSLIEFTKLDRQSFEDGVYKIRHSFGYRPGSIEELYACCGDMPWEEIEKFNEWYRTSRVDLK